MLLFISDIKLKAKESSLGIYFENICSNMYLCLFIKLTKKVSVAWLLKIPSKPQWKGKKDSQSIPYIEALHFLPRHFQECPLRVASKYCFAIINHVAIYFVNYSSLEYISTCLNGLPCTFTWFIFWNCIVSEINIFYFEGLLYSFFFPEHWSHTNFPKWLVDKMI